VIETGLLEASLVALVAGEGDEAKLLVGIRVA